ncbi:MAG TPA: alpha/beta hydrolase-fold protein, partial [Vicinamibacterales bacterium]|nr:alpha/beta hydrolase-fold protein [Vicinamibacterales bacterium]
LAASAAAAVALAAVISAQGPPPPVRSPEVHADRRVTFRLRAPEATHVDLVGEVLQGKTPQPMAKGADGIWSVTIGPLPPEIWIYNFRIEGVDLPDPANPSQMPRAAGTANSSFVEVPGDLPAFFDARAVPHGEVRMLLYESAAMSVDRYVWVYTPPNYDASTDRYPVYYLLHGNGETQSGWVMNGRANIILDNLIADGKAPPMIVVMPHGHPIQSASVGPVVIVPPHHGDPGMLNFTLFTRDLLEQIIPLVERRYRVHADPAHRAIGGLSMGAFQSIEIGLAHPELFGYVLAYSGGFGALGPKPPTDPIETQAPWSQLLANTSATNKNLQLLFLGCGQQETGMRAPGQRLVELLQNRGINARWADYPGGHVFSVWRNLLHESAPMLFRQQSRPAPSAQSSPSPFAAEHWVTTWATAQQLAPTRLPFGNGDIVQPPPTAHVPATLKEQTVRMIAHTSLGGRRVRVALSNALEKPTLRVGAAHVALRAKADAIVPASDRALTFGGRTSTVLPPGTTVVSDPVDLTVPPLADLAVSLYLPEETGTPTVHPDGMHTAYIASGNATGATTLAATATTTAYLWLASIDVLAPSDAGAIVAFGDSITDGVGATLDSDRAWPSLLAAKVSAGGDARSVINVGLSGNRLLRPGFGVSALARFDRDVLSHAGVRWMAVLLGINDITFPAVPGAAPTEAVSADDLIWGLEQLIERAHTHGVKVAGATIMPVEGVNTYTEAGEAIRLAVNRWIRTSKAYDAVIDFDLAVRDAQHPGRLRADFDPGDHVHPNDAGNAAMAAAIDVSMFRR